MVSIAMHRPWTIKQLNMPALAMNFRGKQSALFSLQSND
jgi:Cu/Ag efflux protein CusF